MTLRNLGALAASAVLLLSSCQRDLLDPNDLDIKVQPGLQIPVGKVDLTLSDVFKPDSGLISVGSDQNYRLVYRQDSLLSLDVADLLELPNQSPVAQNFKMGILNLPGFSSDAEIKLSTLSNAITNPAGFATTLNAAHGTNSFVPAIPTQSPGDLSGVSVSSFSTASFHGGSMTLKAVNNYPAAVNATMEIRTTAGATLMTFPLGAISAGDSASSTVSLAGLTVPNQMRVVLTSFSSPGAGTPLVPATYVPIDTGSALEITMTGSNLQVYNAVAQTQTQQIVDDTIKVGFGATAGVKVREIAFDQGGFNFSMNSGLPETLSLTLAFPSSNPGGTPISQTIVLPAGQTVTGSISLAGSTLDFTSNPAQPFNELPIRYSASLQSSGQLVTLDSSASIAMSFTLVNVDFAYVKGFFGQDLISIPADTIDLDLEILNKLGGSITFVQPALKIPVVNSVGVPITLTLNMASIDPQGGVHPLGAPATVLPYPTAAQFGQTITDTVVFDKNNTTIVDFLSLPKDLFTFSGQVSVNADTVATGTDNFITSTSSIFGDVLMELPFYFTASGIGFKDSIDVQVLKDAFAPEIGVSEGTLIIGSINTLPLDVNVNLNFYDVNNVLIHTEPLPLLESGVVDPNTGLVTQATNFVTRLTMDVFDIPKIYQATTLEIEAVLETTSAGTVPVKLLSNANLQLEIAVQVELNRSL